MVHKIYCFCHCQKLRSEKLAVSTKIDEEAEDVAAPASKRMKMQFRCSKCGYVTDNSMEFQQHIPQHKTDENTPQCAHCGLCFTSGLALNRHLYIVHKVKSPEEEAKDHQPFTESRGQRGKGLCTGAEQAWALTVRGALWQTYRHLGLTSVQ